MFSTQLSRFFANPRFGISTRIEQIPIFPQILKSEKVEKNRKIENLVKYLVGLVFLDANICSNGSLIILKLVLKLLMRRSPMHHYPIRSFNYTFWTGKLIFSHH